MRIPTRPCTPEELKASDKWLEEHEKRFSNHKPAPLRPIGHALDNMIKAEPDDEEE
jgi:hypothetical protein